VPPGSDLPRRWVYGHGADGFAVRATGPLDAARLRLLAADGNALARDTAESSLGRPAVVSLAVGSDVTLDLTLIPSLDDDDAATGIYGLSVEATSHRRVGGVDRTSRRSGTLRVKGGTVNDAARPAPRRSMLR
jgi:hypothetical protein